MTPWPTPLSAGVHLTRSDGSCLMEAVSVAAGDAWTDAPACTHPLLAHLARMVNDAVSDESREGLRSFIPDLVGTDSDDPVEHARIALACTNHVLANDHNALVAHLHHVADRYQQRGTGNIGRDAHVPRWAAASRRWIFEHGPARLAVETSVAQCAKLGDEHLIGLLGAGIAAAQLPGMSRCVTP